MKKLLAYKIAATVMIVMLALAALPASRTSAHLALPPRNASIRNMAPIGALNGWATVYNGTSDTPTSLTYTVSSGTNRVLVVAIASSVTTTGIAQTVTLTYGGQTMTPVDGDLTASNRQHTELYYLNDAGLVLAGTNTTLSFTVTGGSPRLNTIFAAAFSGVDQTTPIDNHQNYTSNGTFVTTAAFATGLTVNANAQAVEIVSSDRTSSTTLRTITYASKWTMALEGTYNTSGDAVRNGVANRALPTTPPETDTSSTTISTGGGGTAGSLVSMTALSLKNYVYSGTNTTTVGDHITSEPGNALLGPGAGITPLDEFSLQTSTTDNVIDATVTLAPSGAYNNIATVAITSEDGTKTWCYATPLSNTVVLPGCNIPVDTNLTPYKVQITPYTHDLMPAPVLGQSYDTMGTVTDINTPYAHVFTDTASATVTIDNQSPANPTGFTGIPGDTTVGLSWTNPNDQNSQDLSQLVVVRRPSSATETTQPVEGTTYSLGNLIGSYGTVVCVEPASSMTCTDTGLTNLTPYYYRIFAKDIRGNYSYQGVPAGPYTPFNNLTTPGSASAFPTSGSATSITVSMPYTKDTNANNTYTVDYCRSDQCSTLGWTNWITPPIPPLTNHSVLSFTTNITGLLASTSYDVRVTYNDTDGINSGTYPAIQIKSGVTTNGTTTVGDHITSEPTPPPTIGPGGSATSLDAFTLQASVGTTDTITAATVTLSDGAFNNIGLVAIIPDGGGPAYCSVAPTGNIVNLTGCAIPAGTSSPIQYNVQVTPKTAPAMPGVDIGVAYLTSGTVTGITSTNGPVVSDSNSATVTVDNQSPANPTALPGTAGLNYVTLNWTNPSDQNSQDLSQLVVVRHATTATDPTQPVEGKIDYAAGNAIGTGTVVCVVSSPPPVPGDPGTCTDNSVIDGTAYYYRIFAMDTYGNYSYQGATAGPYIPDDIKTTVGLADAKGTPGSSSSITVRMFYTDDANTNNYYKVDYCPTVPGCSSGGWTNWRDGSIINNNTPSPYITTITGLLASTSYDIQVTYTDPDGYTSPQTNLPTQIIGGVMTNAQTLVGDGANPSSVPVGPSPTGVATPLDAFTLKASSGTDTVTGLTVTLAPDGAFNNLALVSITPNGGGTAYCSLAPTGNTVILTGCVIPAGTSSPIQYMVQITPKTPANMPGVDVGVSYATTGTVTAITSTNEPSYGDAHSATVTVDNQSPGNPSGFTGLPANLLVTLNWTTPADTDLSQFVVIRHASTATDSTQPIEGKMDYAKGNTLGTGTVVCVDTTDTVPLHSATCTDNTGLTNGTSYYYRIFAMDIYGNYSYQGATIGPVVPNYYATTPNGPNAVATTGSATSIDVSMPYTNDVNGNNTYTVDYCPTVPGCSSGVWPNWITNAAHVATKYTTTITGLSASTSYDVRLTYNDADGVDSPNPQTVTLSTRNLTTVGNGNDPSSPALPIGPGGLYKSVDAFTLGTSSGTDYVNSVTVTLGPTGAYNNIGRVAIADAGGSEYCWTSTAPTSNTVTLTGCAISVGSGTPAAQYLVNITPKSAAAMPPVPGASYATTATVTLITATNPVSYLDTGSATVTIDNLSPGNPTAVTGQGGDSEVALNWTDPTDGDLSKLVVIHRLNYQVDTTQPTEGTTYKAGDPIGTGTVACVTNYGLQYCLDTPIPNGASYYYRIFAEDAYGNYSVGGTAAGPYSPVPDATTVGAATAPGTTDSTTSLTVSMPYTGDINASNTYSVDYCLTTADCADSGLWTNVVPAPIPPATNHALSPFTTPITGLIISTNYDVQVTYYDDDGVNGQNPQVIHTTTNHLDTVGDDHSNDPTSVTIGPGAAATMLDAFTLQTDAGTDPISGVTVTLLPAAASANILTVEITNNDGSISYCSATTPSSNIVSIYNCSGLTASTTQTSYKVRITPRPHTGTNLMPPVPAPPIPPPAR